ncbi:MAG TPA: RidA family protein [Tepidisphaeraceae bacterium]|jgi:enamine deaminase RidA (YjgF/YER057c/UK114 family)
MSLEGTLRRMNIALPEATKPVASYVPVRRAGNLLFVSGQLPLLNGQMLATGKVPSAVSIDQATAAARQCVLNALAAAKAELGGLSRLQAVVRIGVFVQSDDTFAEQHKVANGASDLLVELFGHAGRHARAAVGVNALPLNAAVEVEFIFAVVDPPDQT